MEKKNKPKEVETSKRLVRLKKDSIVGGVASGLAQYFDIDPIIIRLLFVLITFTVGSGLIIYIVLWIVMPLEGDENMSGKEVVAKNSKEFEKTVEDMVENRGNRKNAQLLFGLGLTLFGIYLIFANLGIVDFLNLKWIFSNFWPLILIFLGLSILVKKNNAK